MKNEALYNKTVNILVQAYFNDTLEATDCRACAVGNIVAANLGLELINNGWTFTHPNIEPYNPLKDSGVWFDAIGWGEVSREHLTDAVLMQCKATGYTPQELAEIEEEFMCAVGDAHGKGEADENFAGLMAVIDVLDRIHENNDTQVTEKSKALFVKA